MSVSLLSVLTCLICLVTTTTLTRDITESELKLADLEKSYIVSEVMQRKDHSAKCRLSELEETMEAYRNQEYPDILRLRDIKKIYPEEKFSRLRGSWCQDVSNDPILFSISSPIS